MGRRVVYLAWTRSEMLADTLLAVYGKSSYQVAYNWLADIADRHLTRVQAGAAGQIAAQVRHGNQLWWLERHEVR
jgi:hypothetical protein